MEQLTGSLSAVSLETMQASPITDRLPVEIRLQIFRLVLQSKRKFVMPAPRGMDRRNLESLASSLDIAILRPTILDTALFAVSRQISQEAQDVFFDLHAVNVTGLDAKSISVLFFRHIEFRGNSPLPLWPARILQASSSKLKTVILARENLASDTTLRGYLKCHKPNTRLHCLKLGLYKIESDEGVQYEVFVQDFALCRLLSNAKNLAIQGSFGRLFVEGCRPLLYERATPPFRGRGDLAALGWWFAAYENSRLLEAGTSVSPDVRIITKKWYEKCCLQTEKVRKSHAQLPEGVKLWDLNVAEHGSEVVEWATELIGLNIRGMERAYNGLRT